jgi:hypothetical protein
MKTNGALTERALDELMADAELELADDSEFALEGDALVEALIPIAMRHLQELHQAGINIVANQKINNDAEVTRLTNIQTAARVALTRIKADCPEAIAAAKWAMVQNAMERKAAMVKDGGR